MDRTYVIAERRDVPDIPALDLDDRSDVGNFDMGYSSVSSASSAPAPVADGTLPDRTIATDPAPDHSAPDISELLDRTVVGNPTPAQEPEADLSRLQVPTEATVEPLPDLTFEIVPGASERMKPKLVDSHNHTYNVKCQLKDGTKWQCSVRNKETYCKATVKQTGMCFAPGPQPHTCTPKVSTLPAAKARAQITKEALAHPFQSASSIVNQALLDHLPSDAPTDGLPKLDTLVRQANKRRQGSRPSNPTSLDFELQEDALPKDFLREDIQVNQRRHLMFFTPFMLTLLTAAKEWYVDATFKSVGAPFTQLWSIHAFIKQGDTMKQVPLVFVIMSGKSEDDYTAVLRRLVAHFKTAPALRTTVLDFEAAVWNAMRSVFPDVELRGCSFHWSQALWKHIQELGLTCSYMKKSLTHKFIRRLFSLPFLPAHAITPVFDSILAMPDIAEPLRQLLNYIKNTWISSRIWSPSSWSVYNRLIRTNNDVEGWHRRLNSRIHRHNLPLYQLIQVLYEEATLLPLQAQLVSEGKLTRHEKTRNKQQQQKIVSIWDRYDHKELTELGVLKEIAIVYTPVTRVR